jgi:hypothetical protein
VSRRVLMMHKDCPGEPLPPTERWVTMAICDEAYSADRTGVSV